MWDSGGALEGPDTATLGAEFRDYRGKGIHFSAKGCKAHGELWAAKVAAWLDEVVGK